MISNMMTTRYISADEWLDVSRKFRDLSFEQSLTYGTAAVNRIGGVLKFLVVEDAGQIIAATSIRLKTIPGLGRGIAWVPSGPLVQPIDGDAPDNAVLQEILTALRDQLCGNEGHVLRLRFPGTAFHDKPQTDHIAAACGYLPTDKVPTYMSFAMDLHKDHDTMLKDLMGKWRTDLRYAWKSDLSLDTGYSPELQRRFMVLFEDIQKEKGFQPDISPEFHFALDGDDLKYDILIATKDGQDLAGIVVGTSGKVTTYLFGATADAGRRLRAGFFLTWEGIKLSRDRGLDWYDLGGIDFEENPAVARFKDRMNGSAIYAAGPYEACPAWPWSSLVLGLEAAYGRLKGRK